MMTTYFKPPFFKSLFFKTPLSPRSSERRAALTVRPRSALLKFFALFALCFGLATGSAGLLAQTEMPSTVNINAADAETLAASLKGVGHARAQEIVRYREMYGPFTSPEELVEVKGIGQSTLDMNRKLITLE